MLFNSLEFAVFLTVTLGAYHSLGATRWRAQNVYLLVASYVFYASWDVRFLSLLLVSTVVDYTCGLRIAASNQPSSRRRWLMLSCATNLGILGCFKYLGFFVDSAVIALHSVGIEVAPWTLQILLPPGISFYTFQTLSYTIDIYRGRVEPRRDFLSFALFVAYFPQLVAGPIERASRLLPQLERARPAVSAALVKSGLVLILIGLFKKIAIADLVAVTADAGYRAADTAPSALLLASVYAFSIQIYCDFSAYSDIARGTSRLLGVELMENFQAPYLSRNITDFWRRWHISLSTWLRDYLYIPLGGNRYGVSATYRNVMITMLLGGLWHGAAWAFVVWGLMHGVYLSLHRWWCTRRGRERVPKPETGSVWARARSVLWILLTFHLVCLTWIFFRAGTSGFGVAADVFSGIFALRGSPEFPLWILAGLLTMFGLDLGQHFYRDHAWPLRLPPILRNLVIQSMLIGIGLASILSRGAGPRPFIYFQF